MNKQEVELGKLRERALVIMNFLIAHNSNSVIFSETINVVEASFIKKNLKGLKIINNDLNEWTKSLTNLEIKELNDILKVRNIEILESERNINKIKKILESNKINNDEEYALLLDRVSDIYNDTSKKSEIEAINELLKKFSIN